VEKNEAQAQLNEIGAAAERARSELDGLIVQVEALRTDLESLPGPEPVPEPTPPAVPEPTPPTDPEPVPPPEVPPPPAPAPDPPAAQASANGDQAARLVAMKLAIDGSSREQIEAELSTKFGSGDRAGLLDEVLARAGR
jgi:hypothetical protein